MSGSTKTVFVREATGLVKSISTLDALVIALSGMGLLYAYNIIVYTPAFYPNANPLLTQFGGFLVALPIAAMYVILSVAISRTGGDYVWVGRTIHSSIGFISNFTITIISLSFVGIVTPQAIQWAGSEMFFDLGKINVNQGYLNIASTLQGSTAGFWVTILFIIIAGIIVIASTRLATGVVKYWTIAAMIIGAIFIITALSAGSSTFSANFNALSGSNYNAVITAGQQAGASSGAPPLFSYDSFYAGAAVGSLAFLAFFYPAYFAGEVKQAKRTQIVAQLGGLAIFTIFTTLIAAAEYYGEGPSFANAMAALWISGSSQFPYVSVPLASGLSMFWTQNTILVSLFNLSYALTIFAMDVAIFFTLSRNMFAWSFDRIMPDAFAKVNSRTRTPVNAILIMIGISVVYSYIAIYQAGLLASLFSYGVAGIFIAFIIVSIAAIVFPFRKKNIFESSDPLVNRKIGGFPLVSLLGLLSIIASLVVVYSVVKPAIGGSFLPIFFEGIIPTFIVGALLYAIAWGIRKRQNIDLQLIQKEIPPE